MIYHYDYKDIWENGDFTPWFHQVVINSIIPSIILAGLFIILIAKLATIQRPHDYGSIYKPLKNNNQGNYGTINNKPILEINQEQLVTPSSSSTSSQDNSLLDQNGHLDYLLNNSPWPQYTWIRLLISTLQSLLCIFIIYQLYNDGYELDVPIEGTLKKDLLLDYCTRFIYWIYSLLSLLFAGFYGNIFFTKTVVNHLNILCFIDFGLRLLDVRSYYALHEIGMMASSGYLFTIITIDFSFILLIAIINENPVTCPKNPIISASGRVVSGEKWASIYSKFMFVWVDVMMKKGWKKKLNDEDLLDLPEENASLNVLAAYKKNYKWNMAFSLIRTFRGPLTTQFFYSIIWSLCMFGPPYFLSQIVKFIENGDSTEVPVSTAFLFVFGLFFTSTFQSLAYQQSLYIGRTLGIRIQSIVIGEVYDKSLRRRDDTGTPSEAEANLPTKEKKGNINNLLSVDAQKMGEVTAYIFYYYCFPLQASVCIWGLYKLLGVASLYGVLVMILLQPATYFLMKRFQTVHQRCMSFTDKRIKLMNELLNAIRIVKFFAWEDQFRHRIVEAREQELKEIRSRLYMFMYMGVVSFMIPVSVMITVFYIYTRSNTLTASTAFTAVALFNTFKGIFDELPAIISFTLQANVSLRRIGKFLEEEEEIDSNPTTLHPTTCLGFVDDASFSWTKPTTDNHGLVASNPQLRNLNLSFPLNKLSIICGPTGSGKSTLIASLLGETYCLSGKAILPRKPLTNKIIGGAASGIAYVSQAPWIQNMSIKDNILFGLPYDPERYNKVLYMAALTRDLEILEYGDSTEVGEKGISLSGGQKQRLAIARAVYSQASTVILDDCLSAVDAHTAKHLYEHCLKGEYMKDRTVILVTHHVGLCIRGADYVVSLQDGQILSAGTPAHVINSGALGDDFNLLEDIVTSNEAEAVEGSVPIIPLNVNTSHHKDGQGKLIKEEERVEGGVHFSVYQTYVKSSGGYFYWVIVLLFFCLAQGSVLSQDYWIKVWAAAYDIVNIKSVTLMTMMTMSTFDHYPSSQLQSKATNDDSNDSGNVNVNYYLAIYFLLGMVALCINTLKSYILYNGSILASRLLHAQLLNSILRAKVRYFDTTPLGRIVNRFSSDMETIDQSVSPALGFLLYSMIATAYVVILISFITPTFMIAGVVIAYLYWKVGNYYLRSSRDMKRLNSVSRSPIYAQFHESLNGIVTIRAFGATRRFTDENFRKIDCNNRSFIWMWACNRWLHCRVDILGAFVGFCTGLVLILSRDFVDAGLAGLSLSYSLTFTRHVLWVVRCYALNEMNCVSIERVKGYLDIEPEVNNDHTHHQQVSPQWPATGKVKVDNLLVRYAPELPAVLHNISFDVQPSEKIGIVGKTGSGKSSLALSFFRFMEPSEGTIYIDNVDITQLSLYDLRSRLTIIPQDPVLFSGTIRSNLDPFNQHDDATLWAALKRSHLLQPQKDTNHNQSNSNDITLDTPVSENGNNFSQGQRQLIALSRALVKKSSLIILDEATSSVDFETDRRIQNTIRSEFVDSTLLTVAHRINTVIDYDRILVLDTGKIVEFDTPYRLMTKENGYFRTMCEKSGEFPELLAIAKSKHIE